MPYFHNVSRICWVSWKKIFICLYNIIFKSPFVIFCLRQDLLLYADVSISDACNYYFNYACNTFSRDCYFSRESIKNDTFLYQTIRDSEMNSYLLSALIIGSLINQHLYYLFASFHIERDNFLKLVVFFFDD